jgi:hypothetical protein
MVKKAACRVNWSGSGENVGFIAVLRQLKPRRCGKIGNPNRVRNLRNQIEIIL